MNMDFIAIGDTTVDEFIKLKEARVHRDPHSHEDTLSMAWGDKIPYDFSVRVPGVGNAPNAAVAAARLGLRTALVAHVGSDAYGQEILDVFQDEHVDTQYITVHDAIPTNHHYALMYETERTILIRHENYPYQMPEDFKAPSWIYLSSMGAHSEAFHASLTTWLKEHPETKLAFQPGTFQIEMGKESLAELYAVTELIACNKEEAERILNLGETKIEELLVEMHSLGAKTALITDGPAGAYTYDCTSMFHVPMYPDSNPPIDRTGAGDATTSTVVVALALGKSLEEALLWGPINSMSVVQEIGAQKGLLTREEIETLLAKAPVEYHLEKL